MPLWVLNIAGWLVAHWRTVAIAFAVVAFLVLVAITYRGCSKRTPQLNNDEIIKSQKAIAEQDRQTQIEILANSDAREKNIDANISNAKAAAVNAIADSKAEWSQRSNDEIAAELERRAQQ